MYVKDVKMDSTFNMGPVNVSYPVTMATRHILI